MKKLHLHTAALLSLFCATAAYGQPSQPTASVPRLVRFSGSYRPANGVPAQTLESVTLSVYKDQTGGTALWQEVQNVAVDSEGRYSVLMGATQNEGMPLDLFSSGEPRWLGAQFNRPGEVEQARTLLASVPYALKSVDAETLGGKPASAYLLAAPTVGVNTATGSGAAASTTAITPSAAAKPRATPANNGLPNFIGMFANNTDLVDSAMYQLNGNIGISTTNPLISLDARTGTLPQMGIAGNVDYLTFFASDQFGPAIYWDPGKDLRFGKGGTGLYNPFGFTEQMRIQSSTGNMGIGTKTPGFLLDVAGDMNFTGILRLQGLPILQTPPSTLGDNLAVGISALANNISGFNNTAVGFSALAANTTGQNNSATGAFALSLNTTGVHNMAIGPSALQNATTACCNTGVGYATLLNITTGASNIAVGNTAGSNLGAASDNNIDIGNQGGSSDNGVIRIGGYPSANTAFFASGISGVATGLGSAVPVLIDTNGQMGTVQSSRRFKEDIQDMGEASRDLMRLRPVTFRYKEAYTDSTKPIQYGLIAEEVEEVYPDLVVHSSDGKIQTVKYQVLDSMLLNEVQRQQSEIKNLQQQIDELKALVSKPR